MSKIEKNPLISVVITTKNEAKNIERCLRSVKLQSYANIELIIVDNNSEDKTKQLAREYTKLVFNKGPERSTQRNFGMIEVATGKYVMFVDADMVLSPDLISTAVNFLEKKKPVALFISEIVLGSNFWSRVRRFERSFYDGTLIDGARIFRQSAFKKIKGFDETLYACEDWDLDKRLHKLGKILSLPQNKKITNKNWPLYSFVRNRGIKPEKFSAVLYHNESEFNLKKYLDKKSYYSANFDVYIKKWGIDDPDLKKQFGFTYRFFGVFWENGKWLKLIINPILAAGVYYLRFLVGWRFLKNIIIHRPRTK